MRSRVYCNCITRSESGKKSEMPLEKGEDPLLHVEPVLEDPRHVALVGEHQELVLLAGVMEGVDQAGGVLKIILRWVGSNAKRPR